MRVNAKRVQRICPSRRAPSEHEATTNETGTNFERGAPTSRVSEIPRTAHRIGEPEVEHPGRTDLETTGLSFPTEADRAAFAALRFGRPLGRQATQHQTKGKSKTGCHRGAKQPTSMPTFSISLSRKRKVIGESGVSCRCLAERHFSATRGLVQLRVSADA
jgi:hypothetical protein